MVADDTVNALFDGAGPISGAAELGVGIINSLDLASIGISVNAEPQKSRSENTYRLQGWIPVQRKPLWTISNLAALINAITIVIPATS